MALAQEPEIMLLDEPTTSLDIAFQLQILELLSRLNDDFDVTVIMVLHDLNQAARYSDTMVVLSNGAIHSKGHPRKVLTEGMLTEVFNVQSRVVFDDVYNRPYFVSAGRKLEASESAVDG